MRRLFLLFFIGLIGLFFMNTLSSCKNEPDKSVPSTQEAAPSSEKKLPTAGSGTMSEEEKAGLAGGEESAIEEIPLEE